MTVAMSSSEATGVSSVAFYDALWGRTWRLDQHHKCRIHAIERMLALVPTPTSGRRRILELGCGAGQIARVLARYGDVTGIDQSAVGIARAREVAPGEYLVATLPDIPVADERFDVCVLSQVIEHFEPAAQEMLLANARRKLRPGGHLIVTTPNRPVSAAMRFPPGELQPIENWLDQAELTELLRRLGWSVVRTRFAFSFLPVTASKFLPLRLVRFLLYDLLRLRDMIEDRLAERGAGDCVVVLATRSA